MEQHPQRSTKCVARPVVGFLFTMLLTVTATAQGGPLKAGDLLVTGETQNYVLRYDNQGEFVEQFVPGQPSYFLPASIAFDPQGYFYILDQGRATVSKYNGDGIYIETYTDFTNCDWSCYAQQMEIGPNGAIYVACGWNHNSDEVMVRYDGNTTSKLFAQYYLYGFAIAPDGDLYVGDAANHRVLRYSSDGTLLGVVVPEGVLMYPWNVAIGPDGLLYVDSYEDLYSARVFKFEIPSGQLIGEPIDTGLFIELGCLAFGSDGNLLVSDGDRVSKFDVDTGDAMGEVISPGSSGLTAIRSLAGMALPFV